MEKLIAVHRAELKDLMINPCSYQSSRLSYQGGSGAVGFASCSLLLLRKSDQVFQRCSWDVAQNTYLHRRERFDAAADHTLFPCSPRTGAITRAAFEPTSYGASEVINVNGKRTLERSKVGELSKGSSEEELSGGIIKSDKLLEQTLRGRFVAKDKKTYRQTFVVRSYEVGFSRMASVETLANYFQEISLNHASATFDSMGDAMGSSHSMMKHRLIWAITKLHIEIDRYPMLGDVLEVDTSTNWSSKNSIRRDNIVKDHMSRRILSRSTSSMVIMSRDSRRISRIPSDVRDELTSYVFNTCFPKDEKFSQPLWKIHDNPLYIQKDLESKLQDIDLNGHVNNVKYIQWILESVPQCIQTAYELKSVTMEFRKEISNSDVIISMAHPCFLITNNMSQKEVSDKNISFEQQKYLNSLMPQTLQSRGSETLEFIHSLRRQVDGSEILRGKTCWRFMKHISTKSMLPSLKDHPT